MTPSMLEGIQMANSGIYWIDVTFDWCVRLLYQVAHLIGITYEEINVWLFVIVMPIVLVLSFSLNIWFIAKTWLYRKIEVE
jgi:hypothetical protein